MSIERQLSPNLQSPTPALAVHVQVSLISDPQSPIPPKSSGQLLNPLPSDSTPPYPYRQAAPGKPSGLFLTCHLPLLRVYCPIVVFSIPVQLITRHHLPETRFFTDKDI